jgi:hypothetical protein
MLLVWWIQETSSTTGAERDGPASAGKLTTSSYRAPAVMLSSILVVSSYSLDSGHFFWCSIDSQSERKAKKEISLLLLVMGLNGDSKNSLAAIPATFLSSSCKA